MRYIADYWGKHSRKKLLIIKVDAIGDYILFRNFLPALLQSDKYRHHKVTLLGNYIWKDLATGLDGHFFHKYIWIRRSSLTDSRAYRVFIRVVLKFCGRYDCVIVPTFSRRYFFEDFFVRIVSSREKISFLGNLSEQPETQVNESSKNYTTLIKVPEDLIFEILRLKCFVEKITTQEMEAFNFSLLPKASSNTQTDELRDDIVICIFPSASESFKIWKADNFSELIGEFCKASSRVRIRVLGGPLDVELAEYIVSKIENRESVKNLAGQTSLLNLCKQISSANLLITNDTLALHIGVSHNVQVVCVANGNHYGRFMPYPKAISNKLTCVFPEDVDRLGEKERVDKYLLKSDLDINSISVQKVFDASFAALGFNK